MLINPPRPPLRQLEFVQLHHALVQVYSDVTILFSDMVGFTNICSRIQPMDVVSLLNEMYTKFDRLTEAHRVRKVVISAPYSTDVRIYTYTCSYRWRL